MEQHQDRLSLRRTRDGDREQHRDEDEDSDSHDSRSKAFDSRLVVVFAALGTYSADQARWSAKRDRHLSVAWTRGILAAVPKVMPPAAPRADERDHSRLLRARRLGREDPARLPRLDLQHRPICRRGQRRPLLGEPHERRADRLSVGLRNRRRARRRRRRGAFGNGSHGILIVSAFRIIASSPSPRRAGRTWRAGCRPLRFPRPRIGGRRGSSPTRASSPGRCPLRAASATRLRCSSSVSGSARAALASE